MSMLRSLHAHALRRKIGLYVPTLTPGKSAKVRNCWNAACASEVDGSVDFSSQELQGNANNAQWGCNFFCILLLGSGLGLGLLSTVIYTT